jgi:hypothetical protein
MTVDGAEINRPVVPQPGQKSHGVPATSAGLTVGDHSNVAAGSEASVPAAPRQALPSRRTSPRLHRSSARRIRLHPRVPPVVR